MSAGIQQMIMKQQSLENGMKASNFEKPSLSVKAEHFNFYTFNVDQVHCTYFDSGS